MSLVVKLNSSREYNEAKLELYSFLAEGIKDIKEGRVCDANVVFRKLDQKSISR